MHKDRIKIATALGYYARATDPEAATLSAAVKAHALAEYQHDIDCQVAFRKGWQQAEEHIEARGPEAQELRELAQAVKELLAEARAKHPRSAKQVITDRIHEHETRMQAGLRAINEPMIRAAKGLALDQIALALGLEPRPFSVSEDAFREHILACIASRGRRNAPSCPCPLCNPITRTEAAAEASAYLGTLDPNAEIGGGKPSAEAAAFDNITLALGKTPPPDLYSSMPDFTEEVLKSLAAVNQVAEHISKAPSCPCPLCNPGKTQDVKSSRYSLLRAQLAAWGPTPGNLQIDES